MKNTTKLFIVFSMTIAQFIACNKYSSDSNLSKLSENGQLSGSNSAVAVSPQTLEVIGTTTSEIVSGFSFNPSGTIKGKNGMSTNSNESLSNLNAMDNFSNETDNNYQVLHRGGGRSGGRTKGGIKSGHYGSNFSVDGISLLAPNDTILAILDFENINDRVKNLYSFIWGGGTITHYDSNGNVLTGLIYYLPVPSLGRSYGRHHGGTYLSVLNVLNVDSIISTIAKTVIDFGTGVSLIKNSDTVTRIGKIIIDRAGVYPNFNQHVSFENYSVNNIGITGTKTISSLQNNTDTSKDIVYTIIGNGTLLFADNNLAEINVNKTTRIVAVINASTKLITSGTITTTANNSATLTSGETLYSYVTTQNIVEDLSCQTRRKPKNGIIDINYLNNIINVNFVGDCSSSTITITINGVVYTRTI